MSDRDEFEKLFQAPKGIYWNDISEQYDGLPGSVGLDEIESYQARWEGWQAARQGGEVEPVGFVQSDGMRSLRQGHPAKIYPKGVAASPFESRTFVYTHPPAPTQGVPEQAYAEAAQVINAIHGCSQHCDCGSFELAQHWRNETHGGDVWLSHCAEIQAPNQPSGEWVRCEDLARIKNLLCAMGHQGAILDAGEPPYDVGEWGIKEAQELLDLLTNQPPKDNTQEGEGDE